MKKDTIESAEAGECDQVGSLGAFHRAIQILSGRWTIEILYHLNKGTLRFGELRRVLPGITQHMLSARLRELEAEGLVRREIFAEVPPRVEYSLTPRARRLRQVFAELLRWAIEEYGTKQTIADQSSRALTHRIEPIG